MPNGKSFLLSIFVLISVIGSDAINSNPNIFQFAGDTWGDGGFNQFSNQPINQNGYCQNSTDYATFVRQDLYITISDYYVFTALLTNSYYTISLLMYRTELFNQNSPCDNVEFLASPNFTMTPTIKAVIYLEAGNHTVIVSSVDLDYFSFHITSVDFYATTNSSSNFWFVPDQPCPFNTSSVTEFVSYSWTQMVIVNLLVSLT